MFLSYNEIYCFVSTVLILSSALSSITPTPPPPPCPADLWGQASIFILFKPGSHLSCLSYRPSSLSYHIGNSFSKITYTFCIIFQCAFSIYIRLFQSVREWENTGNSDNFNFYLSLFQCAVLTNCLQKRSLGTGCINSATEVINICLAIIEDWWWNIWCSDNNNNNIQCLIIRLWMVLLVLVVLWEWC